MCEPATLALVFAGVSTAVSTVGAIQAGNAAQKQANFQAAVSKNNAILNERLAADALKRGRLKERQTRLKLSKGAGAQRAALAANNVDLASGSALDLQEFTAQQNELEALNIRSAAERESTGFKARAANLTTQSQLQTFAGKQAKTASLFNAANSVLGGASQVFGQAAKFKKAGVGG